MSEQGTAIDTDSIPALESFAHERYALVSSDALRCIAGKGHDIRSQLALLDRVITLAKVRFPKEGDWIVINKERVLAVLD